MMHAVFANVSINWDLKESLMKEVKAIQPHPVIDRNAKPLSFLVDLHDVERVPRPTLSSRALQLTLRQLPILD